MICGTTHSRAPQGRSFTGKLTGTCPILPAWASCILASTSFSPASERRQCTTLHTQSTGLFSLSRLVQEMADRSLECAALALQPGQHLPMEH